MERENLSMDSEIANITKNFQETVDELLRLENFLSIYINAQDQFSNTLKQQILIPENHKLRTHESPLFTNIVGIYDSFKNFLINVDNLNIKLKTEIIEPLEEFRQVQIKLYKEYINKIIEINNKQKNCENVLEKSKINYYKEEYYTKEDLESYDFREYKYKDEKYSESQDILIKNKMTVKIYETIYKYELVRYNKIIEDLNKEYNLVTEQLKLAEKNRINFTKCSFNNIKNYGEDYIKNINDFIFIIDNYISSEACAKDEIFWNDEISKYKRREYDRIPNKAFASFSDFMKNNNNEYENELFNYEINMSNKNIEIIDEKEQKNFVLNIIELLVKEEEISLDKIAELIELFEYENKKYEYKKLFLDNLIDIKKPTVKYSNLNNLEVLGNILSYISLKEDSIFKGKFELNFKIIYVAERIYYQNKYNNNKVYLTAILSKNKYFRTKQFWRNVIELKLAHKLCDYIERLKNMKISEEKKKGLFSKIGKRNSKTAQEIYKKSLLNKSRILPLITYYKEIEPSKIPFIDKTATQEICSIIKDIIQNSANFNFPTVICIDLIAKLTEEYKISKESMTYFGLYSNICSSTVRKKLAYDTNDNNYKIKIVDNNKRILKIFNHILPFLENDDFNKLLTLSRFLNNKLKKKICSFVLRSRRGVSPMVRLKIWDNFLQISKMRQKYNYNEILKLKDERIKEIIVLDVNRTSFNLHKFSNENEAKEKLINVLFATAMVNNGVKYCQGMNFLVEILLEIYEEEEVFYIFISFFESTEYSVIFTKDLQKMKIFFYVFKRIMGLYEPELSNYLNSIGLNYDFFLPPWFITLFTGSHQYHNKEDDDNTDLIMRVLDNFVVYGWTSMMEFSCAILHLYEPYIMSLKYDEVMHFLINDILKSEFFGIKNKNNIIKACSFYKIKKKLTKNIEAEYMQDLKIKEGMEYS